MRAIVSISIKCHSKRVHKIVHQHKVVFRLNPPHARLGDPGATNIARDDLSQLDQQATQTLEKECTMTFIKTGVIALALAASFGATASSALAQTSRADRIAAAREARDARAQAETPRWTHQRSAPGYVRGSEYAPSQSGSPGCYTQGNYGQGVDESACNQ